MGFASAPERRSGFDFLAYISILAIRRVSPGRVGAGHLTNGIIGLGNVLTSSALDSFWAAKRLTHMCSKCINFKDASPSHTSGRYRPLFRPATRILRPPLSFAGRAGMSRGRYEEDTVE